MLRGSESEFRKLRLSPLQRHFYVHVERGNLGALVLRQLAIAGGRGAADPGELEFVLDRVIGTDPLLDALADQPDVRTGRHELRSQLEVQHYRRGRVAFLARGQVHAVGYRDIGHAVDLSELDKRAFAVGLSLGAIVCRAQLVGRRGVGGFLVGDDRGHDCGSG